MNNITDNLKSDIYINVINKLFPLLNDNDKNFLLKLLVRIINLIYISHNLVDMKTFEELLKVNNFRDTVAILYLLLPYINDNDDSKKKQLKSLSELYIAKQTQEDINVSQPLYTFSNIQYNRCKRSDKKEIQFSYEHLKHNYYLLCDTIVKTAHKKHVNWIDILPVKMSDINNGTYDLFINTYETYFNGDLKIYNSVDDMNLDKTDNEVLANINNKLTYLQVGEIYDIVSNNFYHNIKNIKWLIYDIKVIFNSETITVPICLVLKDLFYNFFYSLLEEKISLDTSQWIKFDDELKQNLIKDWDNILELIKTNSDYNGITEDYNLIISNSQLKVIMLSLLTFFNSDDFYSTRAEMDKTKPYKKFSFDNLELFEHDFIQEIQDKFSIILRSINTLSFEYLFDYIISCISRFKQTIYGFYLFKTDEFIPINLYENLFEQNITIKNIYNYCESLIHYDVNKEYKRFPLFWVSLSQQQKETILIRLNDNDNNSMWFNISRYIRRQFNITDKKRIVQINTYIFKMCRNYFIKTIFDYLCYSGTLSVFKPKPEISSILDPDVRRNQIPKLISQVFEKTDDSYWTQSYYYLTNTLYSKVPSFRLDETNDSDDTLDYFDYNSKNSWYSQYAWDWISQINFFHRYINNRVIYVTGGTGVGKSTQIPKLFLYALKTIDYKNGRIINTQPRITPTKKNAKIISLEMGVPIHDANFYVQYKFSGSEGDHTKRTLHPFLRIVTDGTLLIDLKNPILKELKENKIKRDKDIVYKENNLYDIIMIDESHEHNPNMDLILSMIKHPLYYNNSTRLVIISATIDDDEPIYRRFYRDISDNMLFPLNRELEVRKLDRINVDRRLHISPPGQTTKFIINEIEVSDKNKTPEQVVLDIANKTSSGSILLFQAGSSEIIKSVEELNKTLPTNFIALPFYSELRSEVRGLVENVDINMSKIKFDRKTPIETLGLPDITKGSNTYTRAVIVATNIAEASITIDSLRYIVDTGKQKVATYNYKTMQNDLVLTNISDVSRVQRKGRVGRVASGTIYYMYKLDSVKNNKVQYNICNQDLTMTLFSKLLEGDDNFIYFNDSSNPYSNSFNIDNVDEKSRLRQIIQKQYFIDDKLFMYKGNLDHYDYDNDKPPYERYNTGYTHNVLIDKQGDFYIIHPDELFIERNLFGEFIKVKTRPESIKINNNEITSEKMESFFTNLYNAFMIEIKNRQLVKTEFGLMFNEMISLMERYDSKLLLCLLYAYAYDVHDDMIKLVAMLKVIRYDLSSLFDKPFRDVVKRNPNYLNKSYKSDYEYLLFEINKIISTLKKAVPLSPYDERNKNIFLSYKKHEYFSSTSPTASINEAFKRLMGKGKLNNNFNTLNDEEYLAIIEDGLFTKLNTIITSGNLNYEDILNKKTLNKFLETYYDLYSLIYIFDKNEELRYNLNDLVGYLKQKVPRIPSNDYLTMSIFSGFYNNLVYNISQNQFLSVMFPDPTTIYEIRKLQFTETHLTFISPQYKAGFVIFMGFKEEDKSISLLTYIPPHILEQKSNIFNKTKLDRVIADKNIYSKAIKQDKKIYKSLVPYLKGITEIKQTSLRFIPIQTNEIRIDDII